MNIIEIDEVRSPIIDITNAVICAGTRTDNPWGKARLNLAGLRLETRTSLPHKPEAGKVLSIDGETPQESVWISAEFPNGQIEAVSSREFGALAMRREGMADLHYFTRAPGRIEQVEGANKTVHKGKINQTLHKGADLVVINGDPPSKRYAGRIEANMYMVKGETAAPLVSISSWGPAAEPTINFQRSLSLLSAAPLIDTPFNLPVQVVLDNQTATVFGTLDMEALVLELAPDGQTGPVLSHGIYGYKSPCYVYRELQPYQQALVNVSLDHEGHTIWTIGRTRQLQSNSVTGWRLRAGANQVALRYGITVGNVMEVQHAFISDRPQLPDLSTGISGGFVDITINPESNGLNITALHTQKKGPQTQRGEFRFNHDDQLTTPPGKDSRSPFVSHGIQVRGANDGRRELCARITDNSANTGTPDFVLTVWPREDHFIPAFLTIPQAGEEWVINLHQDYKSTGIISQQIGRTNNYYLVAR